MRTNMTIVSGAVAALLALAGSAAWAESASPTGDASDFLAGATCPPPENAACFDSQASGTKVSGTLTVVYDKQPNSPLCPTAPGGALVKNMFVNMTVEKGNLRVPFTTDYLNGPPSHETGFCLLTNRLPQVQVIVELMRRKVIPFYFACDPDSAGSCPAFRIKSVSNFQYTTAHPALAPYPHSGGFSADIVIAAQ